MKGRRLPTAVLGATRGSPGRPNPRTLAEDELRELFVRWQDDHLSEARDVLIDRFAPLARKLAQRYVSVNEPLDDLLQVANLGLLLAIDRFDARRQVAFTSFAVPTILGELRRYFRDLGWAVHVPRSVQEHALELDRVMRELIQRHGRAPTTSELAQVLEWSLEDVLDGLEAANAHHTISLDIQSGGADGESQTLLDGFGAEDPGFAFAIDRLSVVGAARSLDIEQRRILYSRFVNDMTQAEIGEELGSRRCRFRGFCGS